MSQELWPCNGEDPWLSSKGCTMCVRKAIICSLRASSIVWSENGPCCGTIAYFVGGKKRGGFYFIWYVLNFINLRELFGDIFNLGICCGIRSAICLEICHVGKNIKKIMVYRNFPQAHLLEVGLTQIPVDHAPLSIICHVGLHVDFGPLGLHLLVWNELGQSPPFRPMRALTLPWSRAFSLVCEVALSGAIEKFHQSEGHFTHETESPWPLHFQHSHWWKRRTGPSSLLHTTLEEPTEYVNARWKCLHGFLHGIEWIMFHGRLDWFQKPPRGGRPNTKLEDHGTPKAHNHGFISHTSQELWPWSCENPKESVQRLSWCTSHNHVVVWSRALKCSVKSYVPWPSTKCYFDGFLFMWVLTHDKIE
jgi:hypothetical protein